MNEQLRKRLEEAPEKIAPVGFDQWGVSVARNVFKFGVECGYKEAIAQAKEWLIDHFSASVECNENGEPLAKSYIEGRELAIKMLTDFETYMNKLWEEKIINELAKLKNK